MEHELEIAAGRRREIAAAPAGEERTRLSYGLSENRLGVGLNAGPIDINRVKISFRPNFIEKLNRRTSEPGVAGFPCSALKVCWLEAGGGHIVKWPSTDVAPLSNEGAPMEPFVAAPRWQWGNN